MGARILSIDFHHTGSRNSAVYTIGPRNRAPSFLTDLLYIGSPALRFREIAGRVGGSTLMIQ